VSDTERGGTECRWGELPTDVVPLGRRGEEEAEARGVEAKAER